MALSIDKKIEIISARLNAPEKQKLKDTLGDLTDLDKRDLENLELAAIEFYRRMDKPRVFQPFLMEMSFGTLKPILEKVKDYLVVMNGADPEERSVVVHDFGEKTFSVSFGRIETVKVPKMNLRGEKIPGETETQHLFYNFEAEFLEVNKKQISVVLKFPSLVKEPNKLYHYGSETEFFLEWIDKKIKQKIVPVSLKAFFQKLKNGSDYDKTGFIAYDLKGPKAIVSTTISIDSGRGGTSTNAHRTVDEIIQPQVAAHLVQQVGKSLTKLGFSDKQLSHLETALKASSLCSRYFDLIHEACHYGRGKVFYSKNKEKIRYTLEYEKKKFNLVRVSREGWDAFEPIFGEIKTFTSKA